LRCNAITTTSLDIFGNILVNVAISSSLGARAFPRPLISLTHSPMAALAPAVVPAPSAVDTARGLGPAAAVGVAMAVAVAVAIPTGLLTGGGGASRAPVIRRRLLKVARSAAA
jgi:hypothetical protein